MNTHPYRTLPEKNYWSKGFKTGTSVDLIDKSYENLIPRNTSRVMSAGSCFAANLVSVLDQNGFSYLRTEFASRILRIDPDNFNYDTFSAAYGNVYTARQLLQLFRRAAGRFAPAEDRWLVADRVIDPYRPGLRYPARCIIEYDALTRHHLERTFEAFSQADVFIFTLGLTEAWVARDGAVFPACPGTVAGQFDEINHKFYNFSVAEIADDLSAFVEEFRSINPSVRIILTVSPVPLVATATSNHVAIASTYSKSALRVAADATAKAHDNVHYFPAYEIITGPQSRFEYFCDDRRSVSKLGVEAVMSAFMAACGRCDLSQSAVLAPVSPQSHAMQLSSQIVKAECEEAAVEF